MKVNFRKVVNIQIFHEYYLNSFEQHLHIQPDFQTKQFFAKKNLLFKQNQHNLDLLSEDNLDWNELIAANPNVSLCFNCFSDNDNFVNFTNFPIDKLGKFVFTNEHQTEKRELELTRAFQEKKGVSKEVATIVLSLENVARQLVEEESLKYEVHFQTRSVQWKYFIINQSNLNLSKLRIDGKGGDLFDKVEEPNDFDAEVFQSGINLIPLKEESEMILSLKGIIENEENGIETTIIEHLPNASPNGIKMSIKQDSRELFAVTYVYI